MFVSLLTLAGCNNLFYYPETTIFLTPSDLGLEYEDIWLTSSDGTKLHAWKLLARGESKGTILQLHGNAENISTHIHSVTWLPEAGYDVLLLDYRGFGRSEGKVSLRGVHEDAKAASYYLREKKQETGKPVILLGQSIGGAIAVWLVAQGEFKDTFDVLVLDSAFASYRRIARDKLFLNWITIPFAPLSYLLIDDSYAPLRYISKIDHTPILIMHGKDDLVVPSYHSELLHNANESLSDLWIHNTPGHISAFSTSTGRKRFLNFIEGVYPTT